MPLRNISTLLYGPYPLLHSFPAPERTGFAAPGESVNSEGRHQTASPPYSRTPPSRDLDTSRNRELIVSKAPDTLWNPSFLKVSQSLCPRPSEGPGVGHDFSLGARMKAPEPNLLSPAQHLKSLRLWPGFSPGLPALPSAGSASCCHLSC